MSLKMPFNWKEYLPEEVAKKLEGKDNIVRIAANSFWLLSDKLLRMLVSLFVTGWLARYLSVDEFGKLNNAIAFATLFGTFASLGLDSIVIRELVKFPERKNSLLGTAFYLRFVASFIAYFLSAVTIIILRPSEGELINRMLVYIISIGVIFQSFDVIDLYFQSQVKSKYTVFAKNTAFIIISLVKIVFIILNKPLIWFGWAWMLEMSFNAIGLIVVYWKRGEHVRRWTFDKTITKQLLLDSLPLYIAYISTYTYMKVDQIMISKMLNDTQAGFFAASAKVYDLCFFIIIILTPSFFPSLIHVYEKDKTLFYKRYQQVTDLYTLMGYAVLAAVLLFSDWIVLLLYGPQFAVTASILKIQIVGMLFMFNAGLRSSYLTITQQQTTMMFGTIISAIINIVLNYLMIPVYGIKGSAIATGITNVTSVLLLNFFFSGTRKIFFLQLKSLALINVFGLLKNRKDA